MSNKVYEMQQLQQIRAVFPELTWSKYDLVTEGWDHTVIILDDKLVFRFPNEPDYAEQLSEEIEMLRRLRPLVSVTIPNYSHVAPDGSFAGYPIVPGATLAPEYFAILPAADRQKIARQLAEFLTTIHTAVSEGHDLGKIPGSYLAADQRQVRRLTKKHLKTALSPSDYGLVLGILAEVDELLARPLPAVLIHNDIYDRHLLWAAQADKLGIIDFSDRCLGDPAVDFGEINEYGLEFVQQVYAAYQGPKDDDFLQRAWIYQKWAGVYMMTDHFENNKTTFAEAREIFDRCKLNH